MMNQEILEEIADILELEVEDLKEDVLLDDCEAWDSVAVLSVIALLNEKFNRFPHASEIKKFKTIGDLLDSMH